MINLIVCILIIESCWQWPESREVFADVYKFKFVELQRQGTTVGFERLSVEESVGQVFWGRGMAQIDPDSRPILRKIIQSRELTRYHIYAVMSLWLEGDSDDVKLLVNYVESGRGKVRDSVQESTFRRIFRTLAGLSLRKIDGADAALRRMCEREFWKGFVGNEDEEWNIRDDMVYEAVKSLATTHCSDLPTVIERVVASTPDAGKQKSLKDALSRKTIDEYVAQYDKWICPFIAPSFRTYALSNFNGNLDDPGPIERAE